jgi:thioredoxin reductase (NADPH)
MYDIIIIGSGPAGYAAAVYAARADRKTILFAGAEKGGQLMLTTEVENFPGFDEPILGPDLMDKMGKQAVRFGAEIIDANVSRVDFSVSPYKVFVGDEAYEGKAVIVATGASARKLGLPREPELTGRGVSYCATCDAYFFKDKIVGVVGGGDAALEEALFLSKFARQIFIINRSDVLRASKIMQDRVAANPKISILYNKQVAALNGEKMLDGVTLKDSATGEETPLALQGLFVAIGHEPNTKLFAGQLDIDAHGYLTLPGAHSQQTSREGVFAAGDVADPIYKQAAIAAGAGVQAALEAERYIAQKEHARL